MNRSIGPMLRFYWDKVSSRPGGKWLFSRILGWKVPYTGTLGATVQLLESGHCIVSLNDRRRVRNHLKSVHAMALSNLGEMASGLALLNGLPDKTRGILSGFNIEYLKKARGSLIAECHCEVPQSNTAQKCLVTGEIRDASGDVVVVLEAMWQVGPED